MKSSRRGQQGFTLLELLIAMALLAVVMTLLSLSLITSVRALAAIQQEEEVTMQAQAAMQRLTEDLSSIYTDASCPFSGTRNDFTVEDKAADRLAFASLAHLSFQPENEGTASGLIAYKVVPEKEGSQRLKLLRADHPAMPGHLCGMELGDESFLLLAEGLRGVLFTFIDEEGRELVQWRPIPLKNGQVSSPRLPIAVRIRLDFWLDMKKGVSQSFRTLVLLPVGLMQANQKQSAPHGK